MTCPNQAVEQFDREVNRLVAGGASRRDAIKAVRRRQQELAQQYLLATNPGRRQQRELLERFDVINQ